MSDEETSYARHVGLRLRRVRKQQGLSLQAVEAATDRRFKASALGAYERGERVVSVPRLQALAKFYGLPVSQLLLPHPDAPEPPLGVGNGIDDAGAGKDDDKLTLDLIRLWESSGPERDLLGRFVRMIQARRQDFNGRVLTVRQDDLPAMAVLINTEPELVKHRLHDLGLRF